MEIRERTAGLVARVTAAVLAAIGILAVAATAASAGEVLYDNLPAGVRGSLPSVNFETTGTAQFGGEVELSKPALKGAYVAVALNSSACQHGSATGTPECTSAMNSRFTWPVTLSVYAAGPGDTVGSLITSMTKDQKILYRPSQSNKHCTGADYGDWFDGKAHECLGGRVTKINYMLDKVVVPQKAIFVVSYDTSDYGAEPQRSKETCGDECPYDALGVSLNASYALNGEGQREAQPVAPSVGAYPLPAEVFAESISSELFCGEPAPSSLAPTGACWTYQQPAIEVRTG